MSESKDIASVEEVVRQLDAVFLPHEADRLVRESAIALLSALEKDAADQKAGWAEAFRLAVHHQERADKSEAVLMGCLDALRAARRSLFDHADMRYIAPAIESIDTAIDLARGQS